MVFYNIKQSIRGMLNNKTFTFLNLTGFAVGFAVCIIIMVFAYQEYSVNSFIPDSERVYRLVDEEHKSTLIDNSIVPELKNNYPELKEVVSLFHVSFDGKVLNLKSVKNNHNLWVHKVVSTNNYFFTLMGIKVLACKTDKPFADMNSLVIPKSTALKMFGTIDILDEYLEFMGQKLAVSAVVEDIPDHSTIGSDIYCHEENRDLATAGSDGAKGRFYISDIYISLTANANIDNVLSKINSNFPENQSNTKLVIAQPVKDIYFANPIDQLNSYKTGNKSLVWIFLTIAIFTLIMAIFNYANFTISQQIATLKSAGTRITYGATRSQIRNYYITNVALSVSLAFMLSFVISWFAIPFASQLFATPLSTDWFFDTKFVALLFALWLTVIVVSSILPIGFVSRLNIQQLFGKANLKSRKHPLKRVMTITQLSISIVLVVGLITINKQLHYVKTADIGFDKEHLVKLSLPRGFKKRDVLRNSISKLPFVDNLCYTSNEPGGGSSGGYLDPFSENKVRIRTITIDENFIETFGMKLTHGDTIAKDELAKYCYISESAYKHLGNNFEGKKCCGLLIKGVINDLNINSLHSDIVPIVYDTYNYYSALNVKLKKGDVKQQLQEIETVWNEITDNAIFNYSFYDEYYNSLYKKEDRQANSIAIFAVIAFIITCLGLLSQILQTTQNRTKEIGIRKINGASIKEIMILLNQEFLWTVAIAFVIASPIAYYSMSKWLENFAYKTALSWWIFALAGLSALAIALFTVSWQSWRAARRNPVEALRYE